MRHRRPLATMLVCLAVLAAVAWVQAEQREPSGESTTMPVTLRDTTGASATLPVLGTRTLAIVFSTDCDVCAEEAHAWDLLAEEPWLGPAEVVAVSASASITQTTEFIEANDVDIRVLVDESGDAARILGVVGVPHFMLFDPDGRIVARGTLENVRAGSMKGVGR